MFELKSEDKKKYTTWPQKTNLLEIPLKKCSCSRVLMSLQKTVQMERKWEQNADCVKLLANFRKWLIIMSDTEYPNADRGF